MLQGFKVYISSTELFGQSDRILLAVSGGVDSVVMVQMFRDAGFEFGIAHVNFGLRGEESDGDEVFVKNLAGQFGVPIFVKHFDTKKYADDRKISIQMAARDLRYAWFDEVVTDNGYSFVATAHHLDDQAETFFINLLRGTGISGMHGILPKQGKIIRPLMFTTREKIIQFAKELDLEWREDRSNKSRKYLRNKLRLDVLAELYKINPLFSYKLNESISHLRDVETIYNYHIAGVTADLVQHTANGVMISIDWIYEYQPHNTYLFELLKPYGFPVPVPTVHCHPSRLAAAAPSSRWRSKCSAPSRQSNPARTDHCEASHIRVWLTSQPLVSSSPTARSTHAISRFQPHCPTRSRRGGS